MLKRSVFKILYFIFYTLISIVRKFKKNELENSVLAELFIKFNNIIVLNKCKKLPLNKVSILLPHCIQNDDCPLKITSTIENCQNCGKCKIGDILNLQKKYGFQAKVATGGTLARRFLKSAKPKLVIAVACERDLISGICDIYPLNVYGVFNIKTEPCFNTDLSIEEIKNVLEKLK